MLTAEQPQQASWGRDNDGLSFPEFLLGDRHSLSSIFSTCGEGSMFCLYS